MRHIRLTDGTEYSVDRCGASTDILFVNITSGETMIDLVKEFSIPENLTRIEHWFDGTETDHVFFDGFTRLMAVSLSYTGIFLTLGKE